jgi:hypothetical protein
MSHKFRKKRHPERIDGSPKHGTELDSGDPSLRSG